MTATCETCRFWHHLPREDDPFVVQSGEEGICKLLPPTPVSGEQLNHCGAVCHGVSWERPRMHRRDFCGEHQPRAAAPAPEAETYALTAKVMRACADKPAGGGMVPITPTALHDWADLIDALSATPPRPAMDSETRRVMENLIAAAHAAHEEYGDLPGDVDSCDEEYHALGDALDAARAHLEAHGGGDE